tara:strand:- start:1298 stop:1786 length:489 start_codon:yes stop_codon:yes gene_type:complete
MKTNFQKIIEFHKAFGLKHSDFHDQSSFDDKSLLKLRLGLIEEELNELKDAIEDRDFTETRDAIADLLYVVYGTASSFGIQADEDFDLVHESNMTKLCKTEKLAQKTVEWYKENEKRYDSPNYRLSDDKIHWVVYNESTGKILKSIEYKPVELKPQVFKEEA